MADRWVWREAPPAAGLDSAGAKPEDGRQEDRRGSRRRRRSCSRSRSARRTREGRSRGRRRRHGHRKDSAERLQVLEEDIPFLLGKGGRTLLKIGRVAGCQVELPPNSTVVELRGPKQARASAKRYMSSLLGQKRGFVKAEAELAAGNCTAVEVPRAVVGLVLGRAGNFLRSMEDAHGVLMCVAKEPQQDVARTSEQVLIFGELRGRRAAQLQVMSAVETRLPGHFTNATRESGESHEKPPPGEDWGTCTAEFDPEDIAFALGKKGLTRRKLERSTGCIVQFVHNTVFLSGTRAERTRAREYMRWMFEQLDGPVRVETDGRDDVLALDVPEGSVGYVNGTRRSTLIRMEEEWGVLMFFVDRCAADCGRTQRLLIFGPPRGRAGTLLDVMRIVNNTTEGYFSRGVQGKESERQKLDTERLVLKEWDLPRLMGKNGCMVKLLSTASGAMMQFVGNVCWVAGNFDERRRCLSYVRWVRDQPYGRITIDTHGRSDVTEVHVPAKCAEWVAGSRCEELRRVEQESNTLCMLAYDRTGQRRLCIFSVVVGSRFDDTGRTKAERLVNELIHESLRMNADWNKVDWDE